MAVCSRLALTFFLLCHCSKLQSGAALRFPDYSPIAPFAIREDGRMSDLRDAEELLMTLTKQAVAEPTSLNLAVQILLKDYIERTKQAKRESDVISGR